MNQIVLVCGGRTFSDSAKLLDCLDSIHVANPITRIIHGGALGADDLAHKWAIIHNIPVTVYNAWWTLEGKSAGISRNQRMLDKGKPDLVVAFPGGTGTADMVKKAKAAKVPIKRIS